MLDAGWLDEVRSLLAKGHNPNWPSLSAIGYRQLTEHLQGKMSLDEAIAQIKRSTRLFVRRQANWFKADDPRIRWFEPGADGAVGGLETVVRRFLAADAQLGSAN